MRSEKANDLVGFSTFPLLHLASGGKSGSLTPPTSLKRSGQLLVKTGWWTCGVSGQGPVLRDGRIMFSLERSLRRSRGRGEGRVLGAIQRTSSAVPAQPCKCGKASHGKARRAHKSQMGKLRL